MIFNILVAVSILLNGIVIHLEWKRIENLEQWVMHLMKQTENARRVSDADYMDGQD